MTSTISDSLHTGDILLFTSSDHWYDWVVRKFTSSPYSHSAMVLRDPTCVDPALKGLYLIQSDSSNKEDVQDHKHKFGVQIIPFNDIFTSGYDVVYVMRLTTNRDHSFDEKLKEACTAVHDAPYDLNLFNWWTCGMYHLGLSKTTVKRHTNRFWCSALVGYMYNLLGLVSDKVDWSNLAPVDLTHDSFTSMLNEGVKLSPVEVLYRFSNI